MGLLHPSASPTVSTMPDGHELFWLVGLLEGEGCFTIGYHPIAPRNGGGRKPYPRVVLNMCDRDIVERAAELMGGYAVQRIDKGPGRKVQWKVVVTNSSAAKLMRSVQPHMGARRAARIDEVLGICDA